MLTLGGVVYEISETARTHFGSRYQSNAIRLRGRPTNILECILMGGSADAGLELRAVLADVVQEPGGTPPL